MTDPNAENDRPDQELEQRRVTQKDIARAVGISHVAVSKALKGQRGVSEETRARVLKKADELGYVPDPRLAVLSQYRHNSKTKPVQAELAWLNLWKHPEKLCKYDVFNLYRKGAAAGAKRLGFRLQEFSAADVSMQRLDTILKTRNIQGILIPPVYDHVNGWDSFPWSDYATVLLGRRHPYPKTHFVSSAQTANTILAFNRMSELGYKRIGFTCELLDERYFGAGFYWAQRRLPLNRQLPELMFKSEESDEKQKAKLEKWIRKHRPDAILNDYGRLHPMLMELGYRIPEDIGLAGTGINDSTLDAGIDQNPYEIGRTSIRILTSLIADRNFGIPETISETLIEGKWIDGSMMPDKSQA
ncbi:LacI family DNA-binding transcriptional regulator [Pontiellaceae bacterium B1224]|nr:LacI family DNA-binding transcriptional regulator [Pontiellaceae bacterium B1224]